MGHGSADSGFAATAADVAVGRISLRDSSADSTGPFGFILIFKKLGEERLGIRALGLTSFPADAATVGTSETDGGTGALGRCLGGSSYLGSRFLNGFGFIGYLH